MKKKLHLFVILSLVVLLFSCDKNDVETPASRVITSIYQNNISSGNLELDKIPVTLTFNYNSSGQLIEVKYIAKDNEIAQKYLPNYKIEYKNDEILEISEGYELPLSPNLGGSMDDIYYKDSLLHVLNEEGYIILSNKMSILGRFSVYSKSYHENDYINELEVIRGGKYTYIWRNNNISKFEYLFSDKWTPRSEYISKISYNINYINKTNLDLNYLLYRSVAAMSGSENLHIAALIRKTGKSSVSLVTDEIEIDNSQYVLPNKNIFRYEYEFDDKGYPVKVKIYVTRGNSTDSSSGLDMGEEKLISIWDIIYDM